MEDKDATKGRSKITEKMAELHTVEGHLQQVHPPGSLFTSFCLDVSASRGGNPSLPPISHCVKPPGLPTVTRLAPHTLPTAILRLGKQGARVQRNANCKKKKNANSRDLLLPSLKEKINCLRPEYRNSNRHLLPGDLSLSACQWAHV